jgi:HK97 family phage major capsid protein
MATYKGVEIDTKPTSAMAEEAQRALDWRAEFGRGGTEVGVARARQLVNRQDLSPETVRRMNSFFARHEVDKQAEGFSPGEDGYPSAGRIAWGLWGGDPGQSWAGERASRMDTIDNKDRAAPDALVVGDYVSWDNPGGRARGQIERIIREGSLNIPDSDFTINGSEDDPAALIRLFQDTAEGYEATDTLVGHRFSTLTKIQALRGHASQESQKSLADSESESVEFELVPEERLMETIERHISAIMETDDEIVITFKKAMDEDVEETVDEALEEMSEMDVMAVERKAEKLITRADAMDAVIKDDRRVEMSISSETPVERINGMEILEHSANAIDLSFLNSGRAPLLLDHDSTQQIGVVESVTLDDASRKLRAKVRFGKNGRASEVYEDIVDNIRGNVSIGYYVKKVQRTDNGYRATSWMPLEVSIVSIPADTSVGVGRSADAPEPVIEVISNSQGDSKMSDQTTGAVTAEAAIEARNAELKKISDLAARHNQSQLVTEAIGRNMSYAQFQGYLLERNLDKPLHAPDVDMSAKEVKQYSLMRAIDSVARNGRVTGFEAEISNEIAKQCGKDARGFYVPAGLFGKRDALTSSPTNGSNLIATDHLAAEFIDALRANLVIGGLGARMLQGLKGDVAIPKMGTTSTVAFVAENSAPSESAPTFTQVTMTPRTMAAFVDISRKLAIQSDPSVEQLLRQDILAVMARKLDDVAIEGSTGGNEPAGILATNGIGSVAIGTNGGAITYASLVSLEREVAVDNALSGSLAYLTNPKVVAAMRQTSRQASGVEGNFILNDTNNLLGYNVASTTQVPSDLTKGTSTANCSAVIFGNFADLMIGMWNSPDVLVDPYTGSSAGTIRIAVYQEVDVKVRHAQSFAAIKDVTTA